MISSSFHGSFLGRSRSTISGSSKEAEHEEEQADTSVSLFDETTGTSLAWVRPTASNWRICLSIKR